MGDGGGGYVGLGRKVPGCGPQSRQSGPIEVMLIGEAPGAAEEAKGRPLVGKTGVETRRLCRQAGIDFDKTWRTNVLKYRPFTRSKTGNVKPTSAEIRRDEGELVDELEKIRPRFVLAVGAVAARWLLGNSVFTGMEDCHGFPFEAENRRAGERYIDSPYDRDRRVAKRRNLNHSTDLLVGRRDTLHAQHRGNGNEMVVRALAAAKCGVARFVVIPVYHPASGLHQPENQPSIYFDFQQAGKYVRGSLPLVRPIDEFPDPDYYEPRGQVALAKTLPVAVDTEGLKGRVWGLSFCQTPGSAGVVRKTNRKALESIKKGLLA